MWIDTLTKPCLKLLNIIIIYDKHSNECHYYILKMPQFHKLVDTCAILL